MSEPCTCSPAFPWSTHVGNCRQRTTSSPPMDDIPKATQRLQDKAESLGWRTEVDRVQGRWKGAPIDSVVLKLRRDDVRLAVCWENGAFRTALRQSPFGKLNSREVTAVVTS